ncbi:MAG: hypothetical protein HXX20_11125, partial [Chloroflexi bacterium]|nr:hypothetical protein [Chloroflexota bacterium]
QAGPDDLAGLVGFNLETFGKPGFVDMTDPEQPRFVTRPMNMGVVGNLPAPATITNSLPIPATGDFVSSLSPRERALYASYLAGTVFPVLHKSDFQNLPGVSIFEVFEPLELQWYYREWKNTLSVR